MKTLEKLKVPALAALLLLPASALLAQPPGGPGGLGGGQGFGPGGPGKGFMLDRMAERLDLTEVQRAEIEALHETHRDEVEPLIEQERAARQAIGELMRSDSFDEGAVRAAARQAADLEVELTVIRARHRSELHSILTPEQQAKAAELREEWQERGRGFGGRPGRGPGRGPGAGFGPGADWGPGGGPGRGPGRW